MKLIFKQRILSFFDSYDVYDEDGNTVFIIKGKLGWGHVLKIYDANKNHLGTVKEKIIRILPGFDIYEGDECIGSIKKEISFFKPKYEIDFNDWDVDGDIFEWDYDVKCHRQKIATIKKKLFRFTDTYEIDVLDKKNALYVVMLVVAIDAQNCSEEKDREKEEKD